MVLTATGYVPIEANAGGERVDVGANVQSAPVVQKYSPDQPRVPAGDSDGGQWTRDVGSGSSNNEPTTSGTTGEVASNAGNEFASLDTGTRTDAG
jgi:hypothetical protein